MPIMAGILLCRLRFVDSRRRADFLGCRASCTPSEVRSAGRSAFAARGLFLGSYGLDHVRRGQPQQYKADVEVCARPGKAPFLYLVKQLALGSDGGARS